MATPGQLTIDGQEVTGSVMDLQGLASGVEWVKPQLWTPTRGDHIRIMVEFSLEDIRYPWKHNSEGVPSKPIRERLFLTPVKPELIDDIAFVTKAAIDQAWDQAHAGQQATG